LLDSQPSFLGEIDEPLSSAKTFRHSNSILIRVQFVEKLKTLQSLIFIRAKAWWQERVEAVNSAAASVWWESPSRADSLPGQCKPF